MSQIELLLRHIDVYDVGTGDRECPNLPYEASAGLISVHENGRKAFIKDDILAQLIIVGNIDDRNVELTSICNSA
ncbi:hypothetical protein AVEN_21595-1 [Araneus ventricosus]|uniref:Uncharacterized protein n=1 Tax=Araneus ventricosus TaxID=182803 RepID=A0A4Y2UHW4_ARAVE|nr:hypothetical protein AVEN_21595-1 [Araneus ventricosus]